MCCGSFSGPRIGNFVHRTGQWRHCNFLSTCVRMDASMERKSEPKLCLWKHMEVSDPLQEHSRIATEPGIFKDGA
jgi:hypothetical protein